MSTGSLINKGHSNVQNSQQIQQQMSGQAKRAQPTQSSVPACYNMDDSCKHWAKGTDTHCETTHTHTPQKKTKIKTDFTNWKSPE